MSPNQPTVTVLGAGVAGLAAAWELERLGYRVEVLEGSGRIGGRVHSHRFGTAPGAPVAELGAMRIPSGHRRVLDCVERLGLAGELRPFRGLRPEPVRVPPPGPHAAETRLVGARLTAMVDAVAPPPVRQGVRHDLRTGLLDRLDRLDLRPYASAGDGVHALLAAHPELRSSCSGELRDFLDDILTETGTELLRIRGGMGRLVDELAARIRGPIRLGRPVVGLEVGPGEVVVRVREGGRIAVRRSRYVVCTLPFGVLAGLPMTGVGDDKREVVRQVRYVPATKVALHVREPFWHRAGMTEGAATSGGILRQTYYPAVDGDPALGATLLASYTIGEDAETLGRLGPAERVGAVLPELARLHPELRRPGMILGAASAAWMSGHRWAGGGCTVHWGQSPAEAEEQRRLAAAPEGGLFFAGEHTSTTPAWIEGALESADVAVAALHAGRPLARAA
jgi:monoamine oxidase